MNFDPEQIYADPLQWSLYQDVRTLAAKGGRVVGSTGHRNARKYLEQRMAELGLLPYEARSFMHPYHARMREFQNLAVLVQGTDDSDPILLVAHYDTCGPQPGADDNAAAIAILLALVERFQNKPPTRNLIFLFPDAEEPPNFLTRRMGSSQFYRKQLKHNLHSSIVLDLVGHDIPVAGLENGLLAFGIETELQFMEALTRTPEPDNLRVFGLNTSHVGDLSDYHILRKAGEPFLFLTCGRWEHYHETSDVPENLNYSKMAMITDYLYRLVTDLMQRDLTQRIKTDTTPFEIQSLKRMLGPDVSLLGREMQSSSDVSVVISEFHRRYHL